MKCTRTLPAAVAGVVASLTSSSMAQTIGPDAFGYSATGTVNNVFDDISSAGVTPGTAIFDNATAGTPAVEIAMGFNFEFYGQSYSSAFIRADGLISFGAAIPFPDDGTARDVTESFSDSLGSFDHPAVAVMWDVAWNTFSPADQVYYLTEGIAGNQRFIVQWNQLEHFNSDLSGSGTPATFQVVLREGSSTIEMRYLDTDVNNPLVDDGAFASVGIRNTGAPGNGETLQWCSRLNQAGVSSGLTIEWVPPSGPTDPSEAIDDLVDFVVELNIHHGISNALDSKLDSALNALDDANVNNDGAAVNALQAFINHVEAQRGNKITDQQADDLIAHAQAIIDLILNG